MERLKSGCYEGRWDRSAVQTVVMATALHFLVDGLCACCLYLMVQRGDMWQMVEVFLAYNVVAFMTQPLTGWWADSLRRRHWLLLLSAGWLLAALVVEMLTRGATVGCQFAVALLLGVGNSLFHVWGGKQVAVETRNDMRALGVFVSSGAVGLTVGVLASSWWLGGGMMLAIGLLVLSYIYTCAREGLPGSEPVQDGTTAAVCAQSGRQTGAGQLMTWLMVAAVMLFVLLRSLLGTCLGAALEKTGGMMMVLALTAMVGKMGGGWLARRWGITLAGTVVLLVSGCSFYVASIATSAVPQVYVLVGVLAINCTMPMTLHLANRLLPGREGLAFGLLAAVLLPGTWLASWLLPGEVAHLMAAALVLTVVVELAVLMLMGERRKQLLWLSVGMNIVTNVSLNLLLIQTGGTLTSVATGEAAVLVAETLGFRLVLKDWHRAFTYSLLCNATSFLVGTLFNLISV